MIRIVLMLSVFITCCAFSKGYTGPFKIQKFSTIGGEGNFELYGQWPNVDECTKPTKKIVGTHVTDTDMSRQAKFSAVMAAYYSGQTIELYVDGCTSNGQPIVKGIYVPRR